jgi:hypothetical protein
MSLEGCRCFAIDSLNSFFRVYLGAERPDRAAGVCLGSALIQAAAQGPAIDP